MQATLEAALADVLEGAGADLTALDSVSAEEVVASLLARGVRFATPSPVAVLLSGAPLAECAAKLVKVDGGELEGPTARPEPPSGWWPLAGSQIIWAEQPEDWGAWANVSAVVSRGAA